MHVYVCIKRNRSMNQNLHCTSTSRPDCNTLCTYVYVYIRVYVHICICIHTYTYCRVVLCIRIHITNRLRDQTATHCNTLQHTATHCNTLQHTATYCNILPSIPKQAREGYGVAIVSRLQKIIGLFCRISSLL